MHSHDYKIKSLTYAQTLTLLRHFVLAAVIVLLTYNTNKLPLCCYFIGRTIYVQVKIVVSISPVIRKVFDMYRQLFFLVKH